MTDAISNKVYNAIVDVALKRNVRDRVECLKKYDGIPEFKKALYLAYNPYIRFGVKMTEGVKAMLLTKAASGSRSIGLDDAEVWALVDDLSKSTAASSTKIERLENLCGSLDMYAANVLVPMLDKSLIKGVAASTVNKAFPGFIPGFGVQLSNKYTDRKVKNLPVYVEPKYDGMRACAVVHPTGEVEFMTRTGRPIVAASYFDPEIRKIAKAYWRNEGHRGFVLDGEVMGDTFNDTVSVFRKDKPATSGTFHVFDVVPTEVLQGMATSAPYKVRRNLLKVVMDESCVRDCVMTPSYMAGSKKEVWSLYNAARESGHEGIIVKNPDGLWSPKRSNDWLKVKAEETLDLPIIGGFEGEGELVGTLGGLIVDFNGVKVRVGSGFTRMDRDLLFGDLVHDITENENGGSDFKLFGNTIEVQYQEVTPDGSLRHPVFIRLRNDKDEMAF